MLNVVYPVHPAIYPYVPPTLNTPKACKAQEDREGNRLF